jgi:pyruvate formate lyase activating enzyme
VTLSGGEPTLYPRYLERLLKALRARGVSVLLETCGHFAWPVFERRVLPHLDYIYYDLKLADPEAHRAYTGRDNGLILENLRRLAGIARETSEPVAPTGPMGSAAGPSGLPGPELLVRVPLIPGITTDGDNLRAIAGRLRQLGLRRVALLPYNPTWMSKAEGLGQGPGYTHDRMMTDDETRECVRAFEGLCTVL